MKIVAFEVESHEAPAFEALAAQHEIALVHGPLEAAEAKRYEDADIVSTFIYSKLDRDTLERLRALRLIATRSTGFDHIDAAYCRERGITISNVPSYGENTVAEHVFALLLTISHRMLQAVARAKEGEFSPVGLTGFDLAGKTIGVVGTGAIGRHVIRIAQGFEMNVLACDIRPDAALAEKLGFRYVSFDDLLRAADIVSLHVPATPQTANLVSTEQFLEMKDGVVLINTARGSVVDTRALIDALRRGKVAAAGLDVLPDEPLIREEAELVCSEYGDHRNLRNLVADYVLLRMPNVVVTPHSAFNTREALGRIVETTIDNIRAFVAGRAQNTV